MLHRFNSVAERRGHLRRAGLWVVAFFWLIQFLELSVVAYAEGGARTIELLLPRGLILAVGIGLTFAIVEIVARSADKPFRSRLARAVAAAFGTCLILVPVNFLIFSLTHRAGWISYDFVTFIYTGFTWSWFLFSVAGALLALTYSQDARDRERRLVEAEAEAREAREAALRYQLNPHFLFNTLNSIAALIDAGEARPAEQMVENLSDFLRETLELDPVTDIELEREVGFQSLYLAIEEVRFGSRLRTHCDIPSDLARALVPALITQPLVENAVRHAVARSRAPVTVRIAAARSEGRLQLIVEDDHAASPAPTAGTGVGLANVRARLESRFGADQAIACGPVEGGGFRTALLMPLRFGS